MRYISKIYRKSFLLLALVVMLLGTTGCIKVKVDLDVHDDGTVSINSQLLGGALIKPQIDKMSREIEAKNSDIAVSPATEGNLSGYQFSSRENISLDDLLSKINNGKEGKFVHTKGLLSDTYEISLHLEGEAPKDVPIEKLRGLKNLPIVVDLNVNMPCAVDEHNADKISNENKSLYWNLVPILWGDQRDISLKFTLWNKTRIAIAIGGGVLVLVLLGVFLVQSKKQSGGSADA